MSSIAVLRSAAISAARRSMAALSAQILAAAAPTPIEPTPSARAAQTCIDRCALVGRPVSAVSEERAGPASAGVVRPRSSAATSLRGVVPIGSGSSTTATLAPGHCDPIASPVTAPANSFVGLTAEDPFDAFRLHASTSDTTPAIEIFDNIVAGAAFGGPCGPADLVEPFGLLDLADIGAFVTAFPAMDPLADLAPPFGLFDLADIGAFIGSFTGGCP